MKTTLADFPEIWSVDFEYWALDGERPHVICLVAREFRSGICIRLFREEILDLPAPPYPTTRHALFVAYNAAAEFSCHLTLGWPIPCRVLDLYAEFRWLTSGRERSWSGGFGLLGALSFFGRDTMDAAEKDSMRKLAMRGGPYSAGEKAALLDYCASDVVAAEALLEAMTPHLDLPRALLRGRYMEAVAVMVHNGIPIDERLYRDLNDNWDAIRRSLIEDVNQHYGVYDGLTFKQDRFLEYLKAHAISWPMTGSGRPCLDRDTFKAQAESHPQLEDLRYLRETLSELRNYRLEVGSDGRNRTSLFPFGTATGRNAPSTTRFVFGLPAFLRSLIKPPTGYSIAYVDWSAQEIAIAAALSGDEAMLEAYQSGDPHLAFAVQSGLAPPGATKDGHATAREKAKGCNFGVIYGMGTAALTSRLGCVPSEASFLLSRHRRTYPRFWQWIEAVVEHAFARREIHTVFGWRRAVTTRTRKNQLLNFPMQATGAEMLRLACCFAVDAGVRILAPVHDAILIEAPTHQMPEAVAKIQSAMERASEVILSGVKVATDAKIVSYPERYVDGRGQGMWERVLRILDASRATRPERCP